MSVHAISDKADPFIFMYLYNKRQSAMKAIDFHNPTWNVIKDEILGKLREKEFEKQFILSL